MVEMTEVGPVFQQVDLCGGCLTSMASALFGLVPNDTKEAWMRSFIEGIIK